MFLVGALCSSESYLMMIWVTDVKSTWAATVILASGREATLMPSARLGYVHKPDFLSVN